jgi:ABC-type multidrug transport system permease subunit
VEAIRYAAAAIYYALPNLERFNLKGEISTLAAVPFSRVVGGIAYGALYSAIFLVVAAILFERRDLK